MKRHIFRVISVSVAGPYALDLTFDDGRRQAVNLRDILRGEMFGPLLDLRVFNEVEIDRQLGTIVWPNGVDMDPGVLHDWPQYAAAMATMARKWRSASGRKYPETDAHRLKVAEGRATYRTRRRARRRVRE